MPTIAKHPTTGVIHLILGEGEKIPAEFNVENVVVYRRDSTTDWELDLVKPLGMIAKETLVKGNRELACGHVNEDGNPIHEHKDGTWWFYDEAWELENGPYPTFDEAYNALGEYCVGLERAANIAAEVAESMGKGVSTDSIVKQLTDRIFPNGVPDEKDDSKDS